MASVINSGRSPTISSLRVRLFLTLLIVVGAALGLMAVFASRMTTSEFERSLAGILKYRDPRIENKINTIQKYVTQHEGEPATWDGLQELLEAMQSSSRTRFVMADLNGYVYADSSHLLSGDVLDLHLSKPFAVFLIEKKPILAYFEPLDAPNLQQIQQRFASSVNRSLLLALFTTGLITLLLAVGLSRSILRPISKLILATRKMEAGDLSQRVEIKNKGELGELAQAFNEMAGSLARLEQLRQNMVTDVAHELRTPLSNLRGYLEAIQDDMVQPTPELITSLLEETLILNRLVDDLQELAQVEAGTLRLLRQLVDMDEIIDKAVSHVQSVADQKGIMLKTESKAPIPWVEGDPIRLAQIMHNLLDNAIAYTPAGGMVLVETMPLDDHIEIGVQDTGIGIAPEHLSFIFERFYRVDKSRTRATGGAGLGLTIVKQLVEAHGGHVSATSTPGKGTKIIFTLPVAISKPEPGLQSIKNIPFSENKPLKASTDAAFSHPFDNTSHSTR